MPRKTTKRKAKEPTAYELGEAINAILEIPELAEALSGADLDLYLEDRGWSGGARGDASLMDDPTRRSRLVKMSRLMWQKDPLAKQAVRLWTDYAFGGEGMTITTKEQELAQSAKQTPMALSQPAAPADPSQGPPAAGPVNKDKPNPFSKEAAAVPPPVDDSPEPSGKSVKQGDVDGLMSSVKNSKIFSSRGQQRMSRKLLVDGDIFFAVFNPGGGDKTAVRTIDPLQMEAICDPDDDETVVCWMRTTANDKVLLYQDWAMTDDQLAEYDTLKSAAGKKVSVDDLEEDVVVYHLPFDEMKLWGNGLLFAGVNWTFQHRKFMEARVAIVQALSKYAWKGTVKGGQSTIDAVQARLQSTLTTTGAASIEKNPKPAAGSTWLQNSGIDLQPTSRTTGAGDSKGDGDQLKLMFCAATGIFLHYFGDPSTGNLATATAMELPMLKQFAGYQKLWKDAWKDVVGICLGFKPDEDKPDFDVNLPAIIEKDLNRLAQAMTSVAAIFPEIKVPEVLRTLLFAMGIDDVDQVMETIAAKRDQMDANVMAGLNPDGSEKPVPVIGVDPKTGKPAPPSAPPTAAAMKESNDRLAAAMIALTEKL